MQSVFSNKQQLQLVFLYSPWQGKTTLLVRVVTLAQDDVNQWVFSLFSQISLHVSGNPSGKPRSLNTQWQNSPCNAASLIHPFRGDWPNQTVLLQASQDSAASAATTVLTSFAKNLTVLELNWECAAGMSTAPDMFKTLKSWATIEHTVKYLYEWRLSTSTEQNQWPNDVEKIALCP